VSIFRLALIIIAGTWLERFTWIAGSVPTGPFEHAHYPLTSLFDVVVVLLVAVAAVLLLRRSLFNNGVTRGPAMRSGIQPA
jgi:hypothetical protein